MKHCCTHDSHRKARITLRRVTVLWSLYVLKIEYDRAGVDSDWFVGLDLQDVHGPRCQQGYGCE